MTMSREEFVAFWKTPVGDNFGGHAKQPHGWWPQQYEMEFWPLIEAMSSVNAEKIVEVGSNHGGSLAFFDQLAGPDGITIGIDAC